MADDSPPIERPEVPEGIAELTARITELSARIASLEDLLDPMTVRVKANSQVDYGKAG